ncbi:uncharacterized protein LOC122059992 [Macadamia integrifolia]|uniref:uncharacterized protein LOC122059992 n=1 Tax=Macadamia integrifolia TaxID=60698 RepID=UPI001C4E3160|nr:uncharacterized protein LOC122059992 [Macadamia integrifolia]XP_042479054.1 uncharacterized protein LOC122059992 [Macadamia integrifolia]
MGTELQYTVNPLASIPKSSNQNAVKTKDSWEFFQKRLFKDNIQEAGFEKFQDSMDRLFEEFNRESVKKTMLMHEEIFKEQVRELHRLYKVQKMLMAELRNKEPKLHQRHQATLVGPDFTEMDNQTGFWSPGTSSQNNHSSFGYWQHKTTRSSDHILHQHHCVRDTPSSQEPNGSFSGNALRTLRGFDLERPAEEDLSTDAASAIEDEAGPSFLRPSKDKMSINSSHDPRFYPNEESDVELTLSIGCGSSSRKSRSHPTHISLDVPIRSDQEQDCSDQTKSTAPSTFNRESLQQQPWLFQYLSLNRT